jgi:hypothetical protein
LVRPFQSSNPKTEIGTSTSDDRHHTNGASAGSASNPRASNRGQRTSTGVLPDGSARQITAERRRIEPSIRSTRRSPFSTENHGIARKKRIAKTDCQARFLGLTKNSTKHRDSSVNGRLQTCPSGKPGRASIAGSRVSPGARRLRARFGARQRILASRGCASVVRPEVTDT